MAAKSSLVTVEATLKLPVEKVWNLWTIPEHIVHWNNASPDWYTPAVNNDLREGGRFSYRMEARDGSMGFDFSVVYQKIVSGVLIDYFLDDGRNVKVDFTSVNNETNIREVFEAETENPVELQKQGWQSILNNFKKYTEMSERMLKLNFQLKLMQSLKKFTG